MMKATDNVGLTFANIVIGWGKLNDVYNLTLGAFQYTPGDDGKIDADTAIVARLRMDKVCAEQIYQRLGEVLGHIKPEPPIETKEAEKLN
jgi:hypothetical protein